MYWLGNEWGFLDFMSRWVGLPGWEVHTGWLRVCLLLIDTTFNLSLDMLLTRVLVALIVPMSTAWLGVSESYLDFMGTRPFSTCT